MQLAPSCDSIVVINYELEQRDTILLVAAVFILLDPLLFYYYLCTVLVLLTFRISFFVI